MLGPVLHGENCNTVCVAQASGSIWERRLLSKYLRSTRRTTVNHSRGQGNGLSFLRSKSPGKGIQPRRPEGFVFLILVISLHPQTVHGTRESGRRMFQVNVCSQADRAEIAALFLTGLALISEGKPYGLCSTSKGHSRTRPGPILRRELARGRIGFRKNARHPRASQPNRYGSTAREPRDRARLVL